MREPVTKDAGIPLRVGKLLERLETLLGDRPKARDQAALRLADLDRINRNAIAEVRARAVLLRGNSPPVFADDASAGAGGLVRGDSYITAAGAWMMKL